MATGMILAQWERAQRQLRQLRREAAEKTVTVDVAAGMVRVTAAGDMSIRHIVIAPEAMQDRQALGGPARRRRQPCARSGTPARGGAA
jgi:DNA-binding protein YbaB